MKKNKNVYKHIVPKKAQSSPYFMSVEQQKLFNKQEPSLESLSNLIKNHEINFFSKKIKTQQLAKIHFLIF